MQVREIGLIERNQGGQDPDAVEKYRQGGGLEGPAPRLLHIFPSYGHGGVPIRIATVINHFGPRYRHMIFALDGNRAAENRLDPSLKIPVGDPGIDKARPLASLFRIRRTLAGLRPDLLLTYNWGASQMEIPSCSPAKGITCQRSSVPCSK